MDEIIESLKSELEQKVKQLYNIEEDIKALRRVIAMHKGEAEAPMEIIEKEQKNQDSLFISSGTPKVMKTAEAVRRIFAEYPTKQWSPVQVKDELQRLMDKGLVKSEAKSLINATHTVLRAFVKNKTIHKIEFTDGKDPVYIKNVQKVK